LERKTWFPLLLLTSICIFYFTENFLKSAVSALSPVLITELGINKGTMGLLITAFFLIYGLMQIPAGIFADWLGPRKTILAFAMLTIVGVVLFWLSHSFDLLIVAQVIIGIGCSVFYINAVTMITHWFPIERRATAIGVLSAASGIGNFVSYMGFPLANAMFGGWRNLYLIMIIIIVINFGMNFFVLKDAPKSSITANKRIKNPLKSFGEVLKDRRIYPFLIAYVLLSFGWALNAWMPQFLIDTKGLDYTQAGLVASLGSIAGIPGCIIMGMVSDRLKKRRLPLITFSALYLVVLISFIFAPKGLTMPVFAVLSFGMNFCSSIWILFFSMVPEVLPSEKAGIGLGLVNGLGTIGYSIIAPIYGSLIDTTGNYNLSNMFLIVNGVVLTALIFTTMKETYGGIQKKN
jgi:MFS family permease